MPGFCCLIQCVNLHVLTCKSCLFALLQLLVLLIYLNYSVTLSCLQFFPLFVSFLIPYLRKNDVYTPVPPNKGNDINTLSHHSLPGPSPHGGVVI